MKSGSTYKLLGLLLLLPALSFGQDRAAPGVYAGLDLFRWVSAMGPVVEPSVRVLTPGNWIFSFSAGYANARRDSLYHNLDYRSEGYYFRPAVEYLIPETNFSFGMSYLYSATRETGTTTFSGPYFGDKQLHLNRQVRGNGVGLHFNWYEPLSERLAVLIGSQIGIVHTRLLQNEYPQMPVYYMPGAGIIKPKNTPDTSPTFNLTLGLLFRLSGDKSGLQGTKDIP